MDKYDKEQLKNALKAVREYGMPVATASKTYNIPRTTLRHKLAGRAPEGIGKRGPDCLLGCDLEERLCEWLKNCAKAGFPVNKDGLLFSVQKLSAELFTEIGDKGPYVDKLPGKTWYTNFMNRHPELSYKQAEYLNKARATVSEARIREWFRQTYDLLGEDVSVLNYPSRVWNMDESAFYLNPKGGCFLAEKGKPVYGTSANSDKENITTLITVNASGDFAPPLTLYKFERIPKAYFEALPTNDWGIGKSKNGWMTAETFLQYFTNVFFPYLVKENYDFPIIVFLDGHSSHLSLELTTFCKKKRIVLVCLYPNSTHILQPLDVALFYPLKVKWKKEVSLWKLKNNGAEIKKPYIPALLHGIISKESFESTIKNGFRTCGLFPFNANNVDYSKCIKPNTEVIQKPPKPDNVIVVQNKNRERHNDHLQYIETKINYEILEMFRECRERNEMPKNAEAFMLFDVWSKIKTDNENDELCLVEDIIEFPFPEFDENKITIEDPLFSTQIDSLINPVLLHDQTTIEEDRLNMDEQERTYQDYQTVVEELKSNEDKSGINETVNKEQNIIKENEDIIKKPQQHLPADNIEEIEQIAKKEECEPVKVMRNEEAKLSEIDKSVIEQLIEESTEETHILEKAEQNEPKAESSTRQTDENHISIDKNYQHTESEVDSKRIREPENLQSKKIIILNNTLLVPKVTKTPVKNKSNRKDPFMSVLTHSMYIKSQEEKAQKALEIERKKEERKRKREEKKSELNAKKLKKEQKTKQIKKRNLTEDFEKSQEKENHIKSNHEKEEDGESEINKLKHEYTVNYKNTNFVIVRYDECLYPGEILEKKDDQNIIVSSMTKCGADWKWPAKQDVLTYHNEDILEYICQPKPKNKRGVFIVPEMNKHKEYEIDLNENCVEDMGKENDINKSNIKSEEDGEGGIIDLKEELLDSIDKEDDNKKFVIVRYENCVYPGEILEKQDDENIVISSMTKSGADWKWPLKQDVLTYHKDDILEYICQPKQKNNRGVFIVPNINKYKDSSSCTT